MKGMGNMQNTLRLIMVCCIAMMVTSCGGLDVSTHNYFNNHETLNKHKSKAINNMINTMKKFAADESLTELTTEWVVIFDTVQTKLTEADKLTTEARNFIKKDQPELRVKIYDLVRKSHQNITDADKIITPAHEVYASILRVKEGGSEVITQAQLRLSRVANAPVQKVESELIQAAADYPDKASWTKKQLELIRTQVETAKKFQTILVSESIVTKARALNDIDAIIQGYGTAVRNASTKVSELYYSWTKTLSDMDIVDSGSSVKFQHKYSILKILRDGTHEHSEDWVFVSESVYDSQEKNLGMAVISKPLGKFESEAVKVAQPAGYNYIARPGQSNQYGHWETNSSGNSFWAFYGQYSFMQSMLWGSSYRPIYMNDYNDYDRSYRTNRSYYGSDTNGRPRYGTSGSYTSTRYSDSKFRRSPTVSSYKTFKESKGSKPTSFANSKFSSTGRAKAVQASKSSSSSGNSSWASKSSNSGSRSSSFGGGSRSSGGK